MKRKNAYGLDIVKAPINLLNVLQYGQIEIVRYRPVSYTHLVKL